MRRLRIPHVPDQFELLTMWLCVASGYTTLTGPAQGVIARLLPRWLLLAWAVTLLIGGALTMAGLAMRYRRPSVRRTLLGLYFEGDGLILLATGAAALGVIMVALHAGTLAVITQVLFVYACLDRCAETRDIGRGLLAAVRGQREAQP